MLTKSEGSAAQFVDPKIGSSICCFTGETLVTVSDSVSFHISSMFEERGRFLGTEVKSFDDDGNILTDYVAAIERYRIDWYLKVTFAEGAWLNVTAAQRFFGEGRGYETIGRLGAGARVLRNRNSSWDWLAIVSVEEIHQPEGLFVYGLTTLATGNYFVEELGVHGSQTPPASL